MPAVFSGQKTGRRWWFTSRPLGIWKQSEAGGWGTALPDATEKLQLVGQSCPHGLLAQRIPGCHPVKHQLTRSPRRPSLGGAPRGPAAGHAKGRMGQLLFFSAGLSSNPLGPTLPGPRRGRRGGAARISVSVVRADQLHVETEHTACTLCLPWAQPGSLAELEGGSGVRSGGQRTVGHSFCPPSRDKGTEGWVSPGLTACPDCLSVLD